MRKNSPGSSDPRWILAFDGSCATCRAVSCTVKRSCDGKLEVLPLQSSDVKKWRKKSLGSDSEWVPTLLRVNGDQVRAWTGAAMGITVVRHLGVRSAFRVLRALGELDRRSDHDSSNDDKSRRAIGRAQALRLGLGAVIAGGLVVAGKVPAFASGSRSGVESWMSANKDRLPTTYDALVAHPVPVRQAIFNESSPSVKSGFWMEHIKAYRASHPKLSPIGLQLCPMRWTWRPT
jgi:predicted DCC family thiol-disulfide oxidoreductase YuxK